MSHLCHLWESRNMGRPWKKAMSLTILFLSHVISFAITCSCNFRPRLVFEPGYEIKIQNTCLWENLWFITVRSFRDAMLMLEISTSPFIVRWKCGAQIFSQQSCLWKQVLIKIHGCLTRCLILFQKGWIFVPDKTKKSGRNTCPGCV